MRNKIVAELPDEAKHHIEKTDSFEEGAARLFTIETATKIPVSKSESVKQNVKLTTKSTIASTSKAPPPTYKPVTTTSPKIIRTMASPTRVLPTYKPSKISKTKAPPQTYKPVTTTSPKIIRTTASPTRVLPTYKPSKISKTKVQNTKDAQDSKIRTIVSLFSGDRTRFGVAVKAKVKDDIKTVKDDKPRVVKDSSAPVISEGRKKKKVSSKVRIEGNLHNLK